MYGKYRRPAFLLLMLLFVICAVGAVAAQEGVDVNITKTAPDTVVAGENITYNITVTNTNSDNNAYNVTLVDNVTGKLINPQYSIDGVDMGSWNGAYDGSHVWDVLPAQTSVLVKIWGQVNPSQPAGPWLYNDATVFSSNDPNQENNYAHTWTLVSTLADVYVQKTAPDNLTAGSNITYNIVVGNNGPSDAQNVTVTDALDPWISGATYTLDGADMGSWLGSLSLGTLAPGKYVTIVITGLVNATAPAGYVIGNTVSAITDTFDPFNDNNTASTVTGVVNATSGGEGVTPESGGEAVTEEPISGGEAVSAEAVSMETTGSPVTLLVMALLVLLSGLFGIRRP
ncbi:hypothetical protein DSECCO2_30670 [anaerobic digester metagenome]